VTGEFEPVQPDPDALERMRRQLRPYGMRQVAIWRRMTPAEHLAIVFQAYHLALQIVRKTEQDLHPELAPEELKWRVIRRMHGDLSLGKDRANAGQER
jgi:hypothetical protein